jgi:redox-sensitive bicupin YhaK (pirin superfamily)
MFNVRKAEERGHADHGWLNSYHTFSFAGYRDPRYMGFRSLLVMNEDRVAAGQGFGTHGHSDMEIVSYVLEGSLVHKDSMGNGEILKPGEFQRITAGTGITHSEINGSDSQTTHFYQIWLLPEQRGIEPSYEQKSFDPAERQNRLQLVASPDAAEGSLLIHQDARIYLLDLQQGHSMEHVLRTSRHAWIQILRGSVNVNGELLTTGDGVAVSSEEQLRFAATEPTELMLFDLA